MVFSSIIFLWVLLPCILLLYYVSPKPFKNGILTVFSLFFYAWGEPRYVVLMIFSVLLNYGFGRLVEKFGKKRWLLALCVTLNLLILGYFKYYNFLAEVLNPLLRGFDIALPAIQVTLPIGISFYTFQALSYVVDVYRGENQAQKNPLNMMLYISFFPQLIAGPIVKYHDIEEQIENRTVTLEGFSYGVKRFIFGLGKKVILANTFAEVVDAVYAYQAADVSQAMLWLTALLYMLQIYFDFSGYSDMAIGLGKMFGFTFIENFRLPYIATSIQDFWRKWHISLSSWFKEYVYIPLGGNRRGTARTYVNLWTVFLLTGIWHGAGWTFIFWGIYHGFFQRAGALFSGKMAEAGEIPAVGAYLCGVCRADRLDFLPRGHDRAGIFLYPVYVCAAQRSRFDGTLHEPETLDVSGGGAAGMRSGAVVLDEMERARAGAGWLGDGHKLDRLHGDPVVFHFAARQQYIQSIYLFPFLKAV